MNIGRGGGVISLETLLPSGRFSSKQDVMIYPLAWLGVDNSVFIIVIGLLLFGRRLPEVGRSLGKGIVEFKKGLQGLEEDIDNAANTSTVPTTTVNRQLPAPTASNAGSGYKFDPYTGQPLQAEPPKPQMRFDPYTGQPLSDQAAVGADQGRTA